MYKKNIEKTTNFINLKFQTVYIHPHTPPPICDANQPESPPHQTDFLVDPQVATMQNKQKEMNIS